MKTEPKTSKPRKDGELANRLDMAFWRKHYVATMTADEENWQQREPGSNLGRVFIIILLLHVFLIGAVVVYNIISPKTSPMVKAESKPTPAGTVASTAAKAASAQKNDASGTAKPAASRNDAKPAAPAASDKKEEETGTYEVRSGDNVPGIAAYLGVSAEDLVKLNNLDSSDLYPGRKLIYPKGGTPRAIPIQPKVQPLVARNDTPQEKKADPAKPTTPATPTKIEKQEPAAKTNSDAPPKTVETKSAPKKEDQPPAPVKVKKDELEPAPKPKTENKTDKTEIAKNDSKPKQTSKTEKPVSKDLAGKRVHTVTSKDTLFSIARKYGVKVDAIKKANSNIKDPNVLPDGMKLIIPSKKAD